MVFLSEGMGVESVTILLRWILEPETAPCPISELNVITSQVGDEYLDTKRDMEAHILPLMRQHNIRYIQVARGGHLEADGIVVLEDSRQPTRCFTEGAYKLSDELKRNGTVPQFGGVHRCALKFKAWVIETWMRQNLADEIVMHAIGYNAAEQNRVEKSEYAFAGRAPKMAFGFNADETNRIERSGEYDSFLRTAFYPLMEWGWNRQRCEDYIFEKLGVRWRKSACVYCPFNALRDDAIERHREHPAQVADAMTIEHMSLALNPRGTLYKDKSLIHLTVAAGNEAAVRQYVALIKSQPWALYRVRRIYQGKGRADRAVERLIEYPVDDGALEALYTFARELGLQIETQRGITYAYQEKRREAYPAREEFFVAAPATVATKARHGIPWFNDRWQKSFNLFDEETV